MVVDDGLLSALSRLRSRQVYVGVVLQNGRSRVPYRWGWM
jgi:hypothetical protein